jgi:hypothetical protein
MLPLPNASFLLQHVVTSPSFLLSFKAKLYLKLAIMVLVTAKVLFMLPA